VPFLRGQGIKKLDGFIISHNDDDHSGGAHAVLSQMPVDRVASSFDITEIHATQKRIPCFIGQHWQWDGVKFEVLYPPIEGAEDTNVKDNNKSCVLKVISKFGNILLTGDIEKEAEHALTNNDIKSDAPEASIHAPSGDAIFSRAKSLLKIDVLIAHHDSKTSSTSDFGQEVDAQQVIFTVGYLNGFNHPKPLI